MAPKFLSNNAVFYQVVVILHLKGPEGESIFFIAEDEVANNYKSPRKIEKKGPSLFQRWALDRPETD